MKKVSVGIVGGAGYTGGELIRLLINHRLAEIVFVHSKSNAGKLLSEVHKDLAGETQIRFVNELKSWVDVLFLCVGHGEARKFLEENEIDDSIKIIDLSQDFRLEESSTLKNKSFIYGLPELNKEKIISAKNIANPGCFATAIQLGLLPLAKNNFLGEVYTTGITGSTGAGQSLSETSHFSWRANNIQAYKTLTHQHMHEVHQSLNSLQKNFPKFPSETGSINFIPWRGDFTRGIYVSSLVECKYSLEEVKNLYKEFYKDAAFTFVSDTMIDLKQVVNTNKCLIHLEKQNDKLVIHSAIDNLLKGASGQALQNMNLMFGLDEKDGLQLKASYF